MERKISRPSEINKNLDKQAPSLEGSWEVDNLAYPRKQMRRERWMSLNGPWKFSFDHDQKFTIPAEITEWTHEIMVPFAPETEMSGINDRRFHKKVWYQREFYALKTSNRLILHFGAVDYFAYVWLNGNYLGIHEGGYTPFKFDITSYLKPDGLQVVTVAAVDDPQDLSKPRGKQDWQLDPHSIWYPRTTGIWQTVWVEEVPLIYIGNIVWTSNLQHWEIGCEAFIDGLSDQEAQLQVKLSSSGRILANDIYQVIQGEVHRRIALSDPGIDDFRNELLWSPERPTLIDAELMLWIDGKLIDHVLSYTALRAVGVLRDSFMLNGRPYFLRLVLDQGYWPESMMTAPTPEHFKRDIELVKAAGFNGVRKHQKIEDPEFLYWADVLGLLVWEEMPSAYRFTHQSVERLTREWTEIIDRDISHPCIIVWVPYNESWGVPDLTEKATHQSAVQALYYLTKTLDPSRPVVGNDGWESIATDILGIHDYDDIPARIRARYASDQNLADILRRRPGGRVLIVDGYAHEGQPVMLTEFGGIACVETQSDSNNTWGYSVCQTSEELQRRYEALLEVVNSIELLSGFCYTQFTDTYQEANGLLRADRTPKFAIETMSNATRGTRYVRDQYSSKVSSQSSTKK